MDSTQELFKRDLERFIIQVAGMRRFRGQTQVLSALRRISKLAALK